jgi:hypothetical protein
MGELLLELDWRTTPSFSHFVQALFYELCVGFGQIELFPEDWLIILEMDSVCEVLGQAQVVFIQADAAWCFTKRSIYRLR